MTKKKTISLCMIVKNEEKHLARCLDSVKELVDEMIIIDTGSSDNTVEIAKSFGALVDYYTWDNNFSNARNYSLAKAKGDWILLMDGDDEFNRDDYEQFRELANDSTKDGHFFKTLSFAGAKKGNNIVFNLNLRLLRNNGCYHFTGAIHEQITRKDGQMDYKNFSTEDIRIFHYGYLTNVALEKNKRQRNIAIIEEELKKNPENSFHLFNLGNEYFALGDHARALELYDSAIRNFDSRIGFSSKLILKRILCLDEMGQYVQALAAIEEGLSYYPALTELEYERGLIHFKKKRYTLAIDSFLKCLEMGPPPVDVQFIEGCGTYKPYESLGELYYQLEDYRKTLECFEHALRQNPHLLKPIYRVGKILNKLHVDKKYVAYSLSQYFNLNHVPNLMVIADVLLQEGLYELASGYLAKAKELDPKSNQVNFLLGKTLFYQNQYSEALNQMEQVKNSNPTGDETKEIQKFIFLCHLLLDPISIEGFGVDLRNLDDNKVEGKDGDDSAWEIYHLFYQVYSGKQESNFTGSIDQDSALNKTMELLAELLKAREYNLFEKMLGVLNFLTSKRVLLELAKIYYKHGNKQLAVFEILRSVKLLDTIDDEAIAILYKG